jgi:hypothetical protein
VTVHLVKIAVGIEGIDHLREVQAERIKAAGVHGANGPLRHLTRNRPRRAEEVLDGGCIHWIIKGYIRVRQRIIGFDEVVSNNGRKRCALILDPKLQRTELVPHRPIQGWRYMEDEAAPRAATGREVKQLNALPQPLADELRALGLL